MLKAKDISFQNIHAALIGSSRVLSGIARKDAEEIVGPSTFNCGLSGAKFEEIYEYAKLLADSQPDLSTLIIGLDFFGFNEYYDFDADYKKSRLRKCKLYLPDLISFTYSLKALKDSTKSLMGILPSGLKIDEMGYLAGLIEGKLTATEREEFERNLIKRYYLNTDTPNVYQKYKLSKKALRAFQKLVNLCRDRNVDLKVYMTPAHSVYWQALLLKGYWPILENLKKEIVSIHPIWDFSGGNFVVDSIFLDNYSQWFYDLNHAKPIVGRQILSRIFNKNTSDFGILLTPQNIQDKLVQIRNAQEKWAAENPKSIEWLKQNAAF